MLTDQQESNRCPVDISPDAARRRFRRKGILIAIAGTACVSLNFVTAKYAMEALEPLTFVPLWCAAACVYCSVYGLVRRRQWGPQLRRSWKPLLAIGLICAVAATLVFNSLHLLDPTVTSFLARSEVLFMIVLGFTLLGERFTGLSAGGMILALVGMVIISYASGSAQLGPVVMLIVGYLFTSINGLLVKRLAPSTSAVLINWMRVTVTAVVVAVVALSTGHFHIVPSASHLIVLVLGAFFGPFLGQTLYFYALRYIALSELGTLRATQPLFVAVYASVFLGMMPSPKQFVGGIVVIIGAVLMTQGQPAEQVNAQIKPNALASSESGPSEVS